MAGSHKDQKDDCVERPDGSAPDDPTFDRAYPFGTYGYGPKGGAQEEATLGRAQDADKDCESELIDRERPDTSLSEAQRGETPDRTGVR